MAFRWAASEDPLACALLLMRHTGLRIGKLHSERLVPLDPDAVELVRRLQPTGPRSRAWLVPGRNHSKCNWDELSDVLKTATLAGKDPSTGSIRKVGSVQRVR